MRRRTQPRPPGHGPPGRMRTGSMPRWRRMSDQVAGKSMRSLFVSLSFGRPSGRQGGAAGVVFGHGRAGAGRTCDGTSSRQFVSGRGRPAMSVGVVTGGGQASVRTPGGGVVIASRTTHPRDAARPGAGGADRVCSWIGFMVVSIVLVCLHRFFRQCPYGKNRPTFGRWQITPISCHNAAIRSAAQHP